MSVEIECRPRFGKLPAAVEYSGMSRARLYQLAGITPGLFKKNGAATVVDFAILAQILDALPAAKIAIKPPKRRKATPEVSAA